MEEGDIVVLFLVQDLGAFYGQFPGAGEVVGQLGGVGFVDAERRGRGVAVEEGVVVEVEVHGAYFAQRAYLTVIAYYAGHDARKHFYAGGSGFHGDDGDDVPRTAGAHQLLAFMRREACGDAHVAAVGLVHGLHQRLEDGSVGRGVGEIVEPDEVVYHLVEDHVVEEFLGEVHARVETQREVIAPAGAVGERAFAEMALPQQFGGIEEFYRRHGEASGEGLFIEVFKAFFYVFNGRLHTKMSY